MLKRHHNLPSHEKTQWIDRFLGLLAIVTIIAAWFISEAIQGSSYEEYLPRAFPGASAFRILSSDVYAGLAEDGETILGYVAVGEATGYGGPMEVAVAVDLEGNITGLALVDYKETPSYLEKIFKNSFIASLMGKSFTDAFELGEDIDGVTSATYSSVAIADAARIASRTVARTALSAVVPEDAVPKIVFGVPEITLVLLFVVGYLGRRKVFQKTRLVRWGTMLTGMVVLGFLYNRPLTLAKINMFLLGYWPQWQTNLYWYLLLGGILFVFSADNRNPYCEWFCPFGAAQECLSAIGGAKSRFSRDQLRALTWMQRGLAWFAIVIALLLRNPGVTSYEVFGALFQLNGSTISFVILGLVLVTSLYVHRFWCRALCPLRPVEGFIRMVRGWAISLWQQIKLKKVCNYSGP